MQEPSGSVSSTSPEPKTAAISFRGVRHAFRAPGGAAFGVLDDVDLDVAENEFCVIVGPSGCGKSTLLNLCAGLLRPEAGTTWFRGRPVDAANTEVGYVTQDANLLPWLTVRENLMLPLSVRRHPKAERAELVRTWVRTVGLTGFDDHYPHELSGGMQKRCSIARTLIYGPDVILMDEPFGALDAMTKVVMQDELLRIWQSRRTTLLFVTHDLAEAIALADRIVVMSARPGRILDVLDVDLPRPRDVYHLMESPVASDLHDRLWRILRAEVTEEASS